MIISCRYETILPYTSTIFLNNNKDYMEINSMTMYLFVVTTEVGDYYVIAENFGNAQTKIESYLDAAGYNLSDQRKVSHIKLIAESATDMRFTTNKFLIL
jgi:hypothetical protein